MAAPALNGRLVGYARARTDDSATTLVLNVTHIDEDGIGFSVGRMVPEPLLGDHNVWKSNFGHAAGSGSVANAAVPEPATLVLLTFASACLCLRQRRAASKNLSTHQPVTQVKNPPFYDAPATC